MKDFSNQKKRKAAKGERKKKPRNFDVKVFLKKCAKATASIAAVSLVSASLYYGWIMISTVDYFDISKVEINGNKKVSREALLKTAGLDKKKNIFTFDLALAGKKLEALPWMKEVKLERKFPRSVKIVISERVPVAMINLEGLYYLDSEGNIFADADNETGWDYPIVSGIEIESLFEGEEKSYELIEKGLTFLAMLKERSGTISWKNLSELILEEDGGLTVYAVGVGIPVHLGNGGFESRLERAEKVLAHLGRKGIRAKAIGADFDDRVLVKIAI